ncbi:MAG: hypothetical protein WBQ17_04720 [Rhizomicrobium sp.]
MTQISTRAPDAMSGFNTAMIGIVATAVTVLSGLLAFAPFFAPITG